MNLHLVSARDQQRHIAWPNIIPYPGPLRNLTLKATGHWLPPYLHLLTHWGRVTHICVGKLTIIGSDNGLSPVRRQTIIRTNAGILLIRPSGTNFSEILIEIDVFSFKKMHFKMSSAKWRLVVSASMRPRFYSLMGVEWADVRSACEQRSGARGYF